MANGFRVFGLNVRWYGVLIALGIGLGTLLGRAREKRLGLPADVSVDLVLLGVPCAIVGARLYFVLFSWQSYAAEPLRALFVWEGGLAIYGGILGALAGGLVYARRRALPFLRLADLAAPCFALGQAVGRWGNFINQEAYGAAVRCDWQRAFPIGVYIAADGRWHYATFFYESAWCLAIVLLLLLGERKRLFRRSGATFAAYAFLYALERALVEGLRADSLYLGPLRVSQLLSLAVLIACAALGLVLGRRKRLRLAGLLCCLAMAPPALAGRLALALIPAAAALAFEIAATAGEAAPPARKTQGAVPGGPAE